jgi:20S proteasome alpha/beta subunit
VRYDAKAIGSGSDAAQTALQDAYHKVLDCFHTQDVCRQGSLMIIVLSALVDVVVGSVHSGSQGVETGDGRKSGREQCAVGAGELADSPKLAIIAA